jgi:hypothetical protein
MSEVLVCVGCLVAALASCIPPIVWSYLFFGLLLLVLVLIGLPVAGICLYAVISSVVDAHIDRRQRGEVVNYNRVVRVALGPPGNRTYSVGRSVLI